MCVYGNTHPCYLAAAECLANREAQPVLYASEETLAYAKEGEKSLVTWSEPMGDAVIPLFTAPPAPAFPERLPCPVHLLPGLKFGKGVPTRSMLDALARRAEYEAELEAMTPEQKAEDDARIEAFKALLPRTPAPAVPDGYCVMPLTLTAENGAKCALAGEFKVSRTVRCHECGGEGCDDCGDAGEFEEEITIPWETIKDIYRAAVTTCSTVLQAAVTEKN